MAFTSFAIGISRGWRSLTRRHRALDHAEKKLKLLTAMLAAQGQRPETVIFSAPFFHDVRPALSEAEITTLVRELQEDGAILRVVTGYILMSRRALGVDALASAMSLGDGFAHPC